MLFVLSERDAGLLLSIYAVALLLVPSRYVVGPLGALGTPAKVIGLIALVWWLASRLDGGLGAARGQQPMRARSWSVTCGGAV